MSHETVGSLLAIIANSLNDGLRIMMFADKRAWGPDEFEQLRLLEETLDEAKKDFQELPALVNGRFYYENDRTNESLEDLRIICTRTELHAQTFKDWVRSGGGPIDGNLARETLALRRELHRAQCRAARRVHVAQQMATAAAPPRCLGALQVQRLYQQRGPVSVDEERLACAQAGRFERFGETDIAFVCDFCDGFLLWSDLRAMPTTRLRRTQQQQPSRVDNDIEPPSATSTTPATAPEYLDSSNKSSSHISSSNIGSSGGGGNSGDEDNGGTPSWEAHGIAMTSGEGKTIVFAPIAVANHLPPDAGEWRSRVLCPYCDEYYYEEQGDDDMERVRYAQDDGGFDGVRTFQEHLEWSHTSMVPRTSSCSVM
ncbi:hypothetical protein GGR52DRAFT_574781 [Hypoxylon sp. FL1284]|nr:hypothetical protein GGR52DRAFT_574781 [Hypoxylon sp. FL1284]